MLLAIESKGLGFTVEVFQIIHVCLIIANTFYLFLKQLEAEESEKQKKLKKLGMPKDLSLFEEVNLTELDVSDYAKVVAPDTLPPEDAGQVRHQQVDGLEGPVRLLEAADFGNQRGGPGHDGVLDCPGGRASVLLRDAATVRVLS